ncbi:nuclease-related domain-containing protein [Actinophytocola glycyrrhizae]|uniref:Nuclease-related domain-containing protein n=1 Tax=Actinophytocola glycyrrhizae TaxID=2044873 RepID=A0ABV9RXU3_9PSEU
MVGWVALSNIPRLGGLVSELHGVDGLATWGSAQASPAAAATLVPGTTVALPVGAGRTGSRPEADAQRGAVPGVATFSFTGPMRINECDLFIAVPAGLFLVELKGHPGRVVNTNDTWIFRQDSTPGVRTLRNPLHPIDQKSKELKGRLEWAARQLGINERIPRVEPAVFLSDSGLVAELDEVRATRSKRGKVNDPAFWLWSAEPVHKPLIPNGCTTNSLPAAKPNAAPATATNPTPTPRRSGPMCCAAW